MITIFIVAADYGTHEGWQRPLGAFLSETLALAAIGRATTEGLWCAQNLKIVPLQVNEPLEVSNG